MSEPGVTRLFPDPGDHLPLAGLYLGEGLHRERRAGRAMIYSNFVVSLDGRVSLGADHSTGAQGVPGELANPRDWRLYQELAIQADVIITSGRYIRERSGGSEGSILTVGSDPALDDLAGWRAGNGLGPRPAVAVVSRSLDFDDEAAAAIGGDVIGIAGSSVDRRRLAELEERGVATIIGASPDGVTGTEIAAGLHGLGYHTAFSAAGPRLAHVLIADAVLDRLYVTHVMRLLGGKVYDTLNEGEILGTPRRMQLRSLYFDGGGDGSPAQIFAAYAGPDEGV